MVEKSEKEETKEMGLDESTSREIPR